MKESTIRNILVSYERKRDRAESDLEDRKKDVYSQIPQIKDIDDEIARLGLRLTRLVLSNPAKKDEIIAIVPIGYADGIIRANKGRFVYINNKKYQIVGNICMDMLFIKVDQTIKVKDKVIIIKDIKHIKEIAKHLNTIEYEVLCSIGKRVPRIYSLTKTIDK